MSCACPLGTVLHAVTLLIHQRLAADVERYESVVDLRVVPQATLLRAPRRVRTERPARAPGPR